MTREEILEQLQSIVAEILGVSADEISEDTTFDDLEADSIALLQLVTEFEDQFEISISDESLASLESVADVLDLIEQEQA